MPPGVAPDGSAAGASYCSPEKGLVIHKNCGRRAVLLYLVLDICKGFPVCFFVTGDVTRIMDCYVSVYSP